MYNIIYYDIETYKYRIEDKQINGRSKRIIKNKGTITSIALMNKNTGNKKVYTIGLNVDNEGELLAEVRDIFLNKNNILCAWNGKGFDDLIMRRALAINYNDESCQFFDLMLGYSKFVLNKIDAYPSLSDIAMDVGSFKLANMPAETLYHNKEFDKLQEYNMQDVIPLFVIDKEYSLTDIMLGLLDKTGLEYPNAVFGVTAPLESYIEKENITLGTNKSKHKILNTGGLNFKKDHHYRNLQHFDVSSYYPNMFISLNASSNLKYDNIKYYEVKELPADAQQISKTFWIKNNGLIQIRGVRKNNKIISYKIAELTSNFEVDKGNGDIRGLTEKLLYYKQTTTGNERNTYKVLVNGLYGALDSEYFNYEHKSLSASATFLCRYVLVNIIDKYNAVYGKTDSIWTTDTTVTEDELDDYTNLLLDRVGLPNTKIHWELESKPDELFVRDYNNYVEIIDGKYNFKGSFDTPVQKLVLEEAIKTGETNPNYYWSKHNNNISLFCKYKKYNKELNNYDNNTVLADWKGYNYQHEFKAYKYYSKYGNVINEVNNEFDLPVHKTYGLSQIAKILEGYGFINGSIDFNHKLEANKPTIIPGYFNEKENRPMMDKNTIYELLKVDNPPEHLHIKDLIQLNINSNSKYKLLVTGDNPLADVSYYQIDIDRKDFGDRTDSVKDEILKVFNKKQYVLQSTKSNGYHIFFKTKTDCTHFKPISDEQNYEGLEFKYNTVTPYDCGEYQVIYGDIFNLTGFHKIEKLQQFFTVKEKDNNDDIPDDTKVSVENLTVKTEYLEPLTKAINTIKGIGITNKEFIPAVIGYYAKNNIDIRDTLIKAFSLSEDNDPHRRLEIEAYGLKTNGKGYNTLKKILPEDILKQLELMKDKAGIELTDPEKDYTKWLTKKLNDETIGDILEKHPNVKESIEYHIGIKQLTVDFKHKNKNNIIFNKKELLQAFRKTIIPLFTDDDGKITKPKMLNATVKSLETLIDNCVQNIINKTDRLSFNELVQLFKETYPEFEYKDEREIYQVIEMIILLGADFNGIMELVMGSGAGKGVRMEILQTIHNNIIVIDDITRAGFVRNCIYDTYFYNNQIVIAPDMGAKDLANLENTIDKVIKPLTSDGRFEDYKASSNPYNEGTEHTTILVPDGFKFVYMTTRQLIINNQVSARTHRIRGLNYITEEDARMKLRNIKSHKLSNNIQGFRFACLKIIAEINNNLASDNLPQFNDEEIDDIINYIKENNEGRFNNHMLESFPLMISILKILYGDNFNEYYFKPTITNNNLLREPALKLFNEYIKSWIEPYNPNIEIIIAKTKSTYTHKNKYDYTGFTIEAINGIRKEWVKNRKGMLNEYLNWLVNNEYLAIYDKLNNRNIYCYYEKD